MIIKYNNISEFVENSEAVEELLHYVYHNADTDNKITIVSYGDKKQEETVYISVSSCGTPGKFSASFRVEWREFAGYMEPAILADFLHALVKHTSLPVFFLNVHKYNLCVMEEVQEEMEKIAEQKLYDD